MFTAVNRTIVELKRIVGGGFVIRLKPVNRTIVELKQSFVPFPFES